MKKETAMREIDALDFYLQNHTDDYSEESHTAMMMAKEALKENEGEWIPVSERLPEEEHEVYCQLSDGSHAVLYVQDNWGQMEWVDGMMGTGTYDVVAWREKPEPYKAESEDKK